MSKAYKEIIRRWFEEAINQGNLSVLDEFAHPDYVYRSPSEEIRGIEGLKGLISAFRTAFPDLNAKLDDLVIEGDKAVSCFTITGTHKAELMGIAATGKQVKFNGMALSRFEGGKVIEDWEIMDQLSMFQQLDVVSLPA